jgi:hypothetical protein
MTFHFIPASADCLKERLHSRENYIAVKAPNWLVPSTVLHVISCIIYFCTGNTYNKVADALKRFSYDFALSMSRYKQNYGLFAKMLNHEK